jgi:hypothetical protein
MEEAHMKHRFGFAPALAAALLLVAGAPLAAQETGEPEDYEGDREPRAALGLAVGLVEPGDDVETYLTAQLRLRLGKRESWRGRQQQQGVDAYLEPEVGYWERSEDGASDLMAGVNLVGVVPFGNVESFFGVGAAVHFVDGELLDEPTDDSATKFGANSHFGIDLFLSRSWSLYGTGRFDLVQDARNSTQPKVFLGVRGRF